MDCSIQDDPIKNGIAKYVDIITGISGWGFFFLENDTKISTIGSVVCFLGHILWDNVNFPNSLFSVKIRFECMSFWIVMVMNSNPFNFVKVHS